MIPPVVIQLNGGPLDGGEISKAATPGTVFPAVHKADGKEFHAWYKLTGFDPDTGKWNAHYTYKLEAVR